MFYKKLLEIQIWNFREIWKLDTEVYESNHWGDNSSCVMGSVHSGKAFRGRREAKDWIWKEGWMDGIGTAKKRRALFYFLPFCFHPLNRLFHLFSRSQLFLLPLPNSKAQVPCSFRWALMLIDSVLSYLYINNSKATSPAPSISLLCPTCQNP